MSEDNYMKDPRAQTVDGFVEGLKILSQYMKDGMSQSYFCGGEHDIIHIFVGLDECEPDSINGQILRSLGFHTENDGWAYFT